MMSSVSRRLRKEFGLSFRIASGHRHLLMTVYLKIGSQSTLSAIDFIFLQLIGEIQRLSL